jgi:hypothetical protein
MVGTSTIATAASPSFVHRIPPPRFQLSELFEHSCNGGRVQAGGFAVNFDTSVISHGGTSVGVELCDWRSTLVELA